MIRVLKFHGVKEMIKLTSKEERRNLSRVKNLLFSKLMYGEKDKVMMILMGKFSRLTYEELEEVYSDGCFVLWKKLNEEGCKLEDGSLMSYLIKVCKNIGLHYLRKVRDDVESLDELISRNGDYVENEDGLMKMFDVIDDDGCEEKEMMKKLDIAWKELSDVDKMILECYYWDGCKMDEIAKKIGYKSADSVKSRKNKVLKRMMELMKKTEDGNMPSSAVIMVYVFCSVEIFLLATCKSQVEYCFCYDESSSATIACITLYLTVHEVEEINGCEDCCYCRDEKVSG